MTHKKQDEELPLYKFVSSHEDLLAISRVLNESNLSTIAKEGIYKLIHSYANEARKQLARSTADELKAYVRAHPDATGDEVAWYAVGIYGRIAEF